MLSRDCAVPPPIPARADASGLGFAWLGVTMHLDAASRGCGCQPGAHLQTPGPAREVLAGVVIGSVRPDIRREDCGSQKVPTPRQRGTVLEIRASGLWLRAASP